MSKRVKQSESPPSKKMLIELTNSDFDSDTSDLIILVEENKFRVHREFLASKSDYFRGLLFSGLKESSEKEVKLTGTTPDVFHLIMKYFYNGVLDINSIEHSQALDLLTICHEWLLSDVFEHLKRNRNQKVKFLFFQVASNLGLQDLQNKCLKFWDKNAKGFLKHSYFLKLDAITLSSIIKRDTFFAKEELIFEAVIRWSQKATEDDIKLVIESIRLPFMDEMYLLKSVDESGVVHYKKILNALIVQRESNKIELKHRGILVCNKDIMLKESEEASIEFEPEEDYHDFEYYFHEHDEDFVTKDITITLNKAWFLNCINIPFRFEYSELSLSADGKFWYKPTYTENNHDVFCFPKRVVKFIKLTGAEFDRNDEPDFLNFEAFLKDPEEGADETDGESSDNEDEDN